jgi:hypothetical protein
MSMTNCGNFEKILDYIQELLPIEEKLEMQLHISDCQRCQKLVNEAQELVTYLHEDSRLEVTPQMHRQAVNFYSSWYAARPQPEKPATRVRKWLAQLVMDTRLNSGSTSLAAGLRAGAAGTEQSGMRQLLYSLDEGRVEVDLQLSPSSIRPYYDLMGQVVGIEPVDSKVELVPNSGGEALKAEVDPNFTFRFQKLEPGEYNMNIYYNQELIEIPPIQI